MNKIQFLKEVDNRINKNHLLNHSFYKAWNAGELDSCYSRICCTIF